ncbi:MAG: purine-nucleoside phosphorylase [Oscillospiraceae bacterium]|nr:purine-nucleoside phosphorylase [Oscillospiraceae bacterium]
MTEIKQAAEFISAKITETPQVAIVLGSGLADFCDQISDQIEISYKDIPNFPISTAPGHKGRFVFGKLAGKPVIAMCGRFHFYEGYSMQEVVMPIWVLRQLGVETVIITNAAGGINREFEVGDLMLISDHIKLCAESPLCGVNKEEFGVRFNDMTHAYTPKLRELAKKEAYELSIPLREGVYGYMTGPSYETPAEIRMLDIVGADAVGMSTAPEVIAAAHAGLQVLGISCISNFAAGITDEPLTHDEVMEAGAVAVGSFNALLPKVIEKL